MARVVQWLRERTARLSKVCDGLTDRDLAERHHLKALGVLEAATMVEEGITSELRALDPSLGPGRWTVCPTCGVTLQNHGHGECPSPCYESHIDPCPAGHGVGPKCNPGWRRPPDWKYEEDWGSPVWKERMRVDREKVDEKRARIGFHYCPKCNEQHGPGMTLTCRLCGYVAVEPDAEG
jgi:rubrerythrin